MNPTLNSPKYADPKSLAFQMYKKQQDRKQRKGYPYDPQLEQRYFRRNEGSTDYATIPEVTLAGDQRWEFDILTTEANARLFLSGSEAGDRWYIGIQNGKLLIGNGVDRVIGGTTIGDGMFHSIVWEVLSGVVTATVDGVVQYSSALLATLPYSISNLMASEFGGNISSGILANLKIWDNGTLIRDYPINDGKNILANAATALGNEIDGLTYALTTTIGGVASVVLTSLSVIGKTYLVVISYVGVVGDAIARIGGFSSPSFTGTGTIEFVATATTTVNDILGALTGVTSGSVTVSIKEADGYGTIINGNADDWGLFDRQADGDWLGQELVVNGGFDTDSDWGKDANWSITGGQAVSDGSVRGVIFQSMVRPDLYQVSGNFGASSSGNLSIFNGGGFDSSPIVSASPGGFSVEVENANDGYGFFLMRAEISNEPAIDSISVKEVLKNA